MYVCMYVCMYVVRTYVRTYVCMYVYIHVLIRLYLHCLTRTQPTSTRNVYISAYMYVCQVTSFYSQHAPHIRPPLRCMTYVMDGST